ncbi:hypothetical protein [Flavobacterium sp.]|uniref:hypothetical protein n=1 Tax=Flavobacterium sp. TaxID=239 RepID=UPI0039E3164D
MKKISFLLALLFAVAVSGQGKVDDPKKDFEKPQPEPVKIPKEKAKNRPADDTDKTLSEEIWDLTLGLGIKAFFGNYQTEYHLDHPITPYPFYNKESGNYEGYEYDPTKKVGFRFDLEDKFLYSDEDLIGNHLTLKVRPFQYFYVQVDYHQLHEKTSDEDLSLFYFNLAYDRLRFEKFNLGWSLGAVYMANDVNKGGLAAGLSAEWFFAQHFSLQAAAKAGAIEAIPVNTFEVSGRYHYKRAFVTVGYEKLKIGTPKYNFAAIGGGFYF